MAKFRTAGQPAQVEGVRRRFLFDGWGGRALLLLLIASSLGLMHVHNRAMQPSYSDLVTRWVGTRAAIAGLDPYSDDVLPEMLRMYYGHYPLTAADPNPERQRFYYPATLTVLLAPLAYLRWQTARAVFLAVTLLLLLLGFLGCMEMFPRRWTRRQVAMVLALAVCSWPVLWGLRLQQPGLLVAAFLFLACAGLRRGSAGLAGVLLALATVKPQMVLPLLGWLALWAIVNRVWRLLVFFGIALAILLLCTEALVPHWISHWQAAAMMYAHVTDTAPVLENLFGHWAGLALTILIAGSICISLWRLRRARAESVEFGVAVSLALTLTALLMPMHLAMIYNQVLLFPACMFLIQAMPVDRDGRMVRGLALGLLCLTFALPVATLAGEAVFPPSVVWGALPFLNNSPLIAGVALAMAVMTGRALRKGNAEELEGLLRSSAGE